VRFGQLGESDHQATGHHRGKVHSLPAKGRLLWRKGSARVSVDLNNFLLRRKTDLFAFYRDDLRTANIIADDAAGVSCLVIDRETFNQLISSLDEIKTSYKDEGIERQR
jgi:hypothetical protein